MDKEYKIGVDIGGSHVASAWVDAAGVVLEGTFAASRVDPGAHTRQVIDCWVSTIRTTLEAAPGRTPAGIGIAIPGPFDYAQGISLITGVHKYEHLFGLHIREALLDELGREHMIYFSGDAASFAIGECRSGFAAGFDRVIALTLGTGLGSAFLNKGQLVTEGEGVPPQGYLYSVPFRSGIAEDYFSGRWLLKTYAAGVPAAPGIAAPAGPTSVRELAALAASDPRAAEVFQIFGQNLGIFMERWLRHFQADCLVLGGGITRAAELFLPALTRSLRGAGLEVPVHLSGETERAALVGAASLIPSDPPVPEGPWRRTTQPLLPIHHNQSRDETYDLYPFHCLGKGHIRRGYDDLVSWIGSRKLLLVDGYIGNDWAAIRLHMGEALKAAGKRVAWYDPSVFLKPGEEITRLTEPFMGEPGSVWGKHFDGRLEDFFRMELLEAVQPAGEGYDVSMCLGIGAGLVTWPAPLIYIDLPKNEIQYRMRAGMPGNLGVTGGYKRSYFIDWPVLNKYRASIGGRINVVADGQWRDDITWILMPALVKGLRDQAKGVIRARPWFEPGPWGGQWLKGHIPGLNHAEINYAWSFELIVPENGIIFESSGHLLEISFDWLMDQESVAILGMDAGRFGNAFPIRFDFLDTMGGGPLSVQCHPSLTYIREQFGEQITQDETYYVMDCAPGAGVYLGFREETDPDAFREVLEESHANGTPVEVERYVKWHPSHPHDLFLIPNRTIHSSGKDNLVLEISATPYIYTFKVYDWLRMDLDGRPRPINIEHAFRNLDFGRDSRELISKPTVLEEGPNYRLIHLPTHPEHFYDVHRLEFTGTVTIPTEGRCHVLMVVEGSGVEVLVQKRRRFHYAETFIIPAALERYVLSTEPGVWVKLVKAFIK